MSELIAAVEAFLARVGPVQAYSEEGPVNPDGETYSVCVDDPSADTHTCFATVVAQTGEQARKQAEDIAQAFQFLRELVTELLRRRGEQERLQQEGKAASDFIRVVLEAVGAQGDNRDVWEEGAWVDLKALGLSVIGQIEEFKVAAESAEARVSALLDYVQHKRTCKRGRENATMLDIGEYDPGECTCGLASLRDGSARATIQAQASNVTMASGDAFNQPLITRLLVPNAQPSAAPASQEIDTEGDFRKAMAAERALDEGIAAMKAERESRSADVTPSPHTDVGTRDQHLTQENFDDLHLRCSTYAAELSALRSQVETLKAELKEEQEATADLGRILDMYSALQAAVREVRAEMQEWTGTGECSPCGTFTINVKDAYARCITCGYSQIVHHVQAWADRLAGLDRQGTEEKHEA